MKILALSDIHANLSALEAVLAASEEKYGLLPIVNLGDSIDYGMRPNETIAKLQALKSRVIVNLSGNHERAIEGIDRARFASERGRAANDYTRSVLTPESRRYIREGMASTPVKLDLAGKKVLFLYGDLSDPFWGTMSHEESQRTAYSQFDVVLSGHTHIPSLRFVSYRSKNPTAHQEHQITKFINPGSVGQPRNCNPNAQFAVVDLRSGAVDFGCAPYDVASEQQLHAGEIDAFYGKRLSLGV